MHPKMAIIWLMHFQSVNNMFIMSQDVKKYKTEGIININNK